MRVDAARESGRRCQPLRIGAALLGAVTLAAAGTGHAEGGLVTDGDDRLGESRLFFSVIERRAALAIAGERVGTSGRESVAEVSADGLAGTVTGEGRGEGAGADSSTGSGEGESAARANDAAAESRPDRASSSGTMSRVLYQALLRVGKRVQLLVDDRPCRIAVEALHADEVAVRCPLLPEGVRALALSTHDGRLVVTLQDGRRRRLDVGEALRP